MQNSILEMIEKFNPEIVIIEDTVLQRSPKTLKDLSQLQGAIMGMCRGKKIPYGLLYPTSWRKSLGFKQGRENKRPQLKQQAKDYVKENYGITPSEDECDAICIGIAFKNSINKEKE